MWSAYPSLPSLPSWLIRAECTYNVWKIALPAFYSGVHTDANIQRLEYVPPGFYSGVHTDVIPTIEM